MPPLFEDVFVGTVIETSGSDDAFGSDSLRAIVILIVGVGKWCPTELFVGTDILISCTGEAFGPAASLLPMVMLIVGAE